MNLWSVTVEISPTRVTRVVYPDNRQVKSLVFIYFHFYVVLGCSVDGVRRGSPWTGP